MQISPSLAPPAVVAYLLRPDVGTVKKFGGLKAGKQLQEEEKRKGEQENRDFRRLQTNIFRGRPGTGKQVSMTDLRGCD
eukprot:762022-Hanusia_phi.AAC.1